MLVLYGDSMLSGPLGGEDQSLRAALSRHVHTECCALPGHGSQDALTWLDKLPQWWSAPSIIWVGHNDFRDRCRQTVGNIKQMVSRLTGEWWVLRVPILAGGDDRSMMFDRVNRELSEFAGDRFLDPLHRLFDAPAIPANMRYPDDRCHGLIEANTLIAHWLIANTIGKTSQAQAAYPIESPSFTGPANEWSFFRDPTWPLKAGGTARILGEPPQSG